MPYTLNGIGTNYLGKKNREDREGVCEKCGKQVKLSTYETRLFFVILFIPIIPLGKKKILDYCSRCSAHRVMPLEKWHELREKVAQESRQVVKEKSAEAQTLLSAHAKVLGVGHHEQAEELEREMSARFSANVDVMLYLGWVHKDAGDADRAGMYFNKALAAAPEDTRARTSVALRCLQNNDLSRAAQLLSFMEYADPDPAVLFLLAEGYRENESYTQALHYYRIIAHHFPELVKTDKTFRNAVQVCEKYQTGMPSLLPKREIPHLTSWLIGGAVVVFIIAVGLFYNSYLSSQQCLYVINGLGVKATVTLPDSRAELIPAGERKVLMVSEGRYTATVQAEGRQAESVEIVIENGWWERFSHDKVWILNVHKAAAVAWEETTYSDNPRPDDYGAARIYLGEAFISIPAVDYKFAEFPKEIELSSGNAALKSRVHFLPYSPVDVLSIATHYQKFKKMPVEPQKVLSYLEANLDDYYRDRNTVSTYMSYAASAGSLERAAAFLEKQLPLRPVRVEMHRSYQVLKQLSGLDLTDKYDTLLAGEPGNPDLLYLRGRLAHEGSVALDFYNRALEKAPDYFNALYAKAIYFFNLGRLQEARDLCVKAWNAALLRDQLEEYVYLLGMGLKDYEPLTKAAQAGLEREPFSFIYFSRLLEIYAVQGNEEGARLLLNQFNRTADTEFPTGDEHQLKLSTALHLQYLQRNFDGMTTSAGKFKNEGARRAFLLIAHLNLGNMDKAEKYVGDVNTTDGYQALIFWMGWLRKGNIQKAGQWLERAIKDFGASQFDEKKFARLLKNPQEITLKEVDDITMDINLKRTVLTAAARLSPRYRADLLKRAEQLNIKRQFPFQFLTDEMIRLKK